MTSDRIEKHPILTIEPRKSVAFYWQGKKLIARQGETIAAALFANGVRVFGHHPKDGAPQGIRCANGQCAQCLVLVDGKPVKSCMELVRSAMRVEPVHEMPELPAADQVPEIRRIEEITVEVLIIGGGPAGLSAAIELGKLGIETLLVDDKHRLGGKMVLQTHRSFGSVDAVHAGTRGIDIATTLETEMRKYDTVRIWLHSTVLAVFSDRKVGVLHQDGRRYTLIAPRALLVATGAREKSLIFKGNTLPGVYGAGAFQTLVNRDLVRPSQKLFIVGGGNVGLIAGYHALQAGIAVVGVVEAMPECSGYHVHRDKLVRLGVPAYTSHAIVSANGDEKVESVTIAQVSKSFRPIIGTERSFTCDTVLVAVGLDPVNEFYLKAQEVGLRAFAAGDAEEIAEASSAMFSGKIKALEVARALGYPVAESPQNWYHAVEILKSKPGKTKKNPLPEAESGIVPIFHCSQEIPCDPCTAVCPQEAIYIDKADIRQIPTFSGEQSGRPCIGCEKCVTICPGLAITLVDYREDPEVPTVAIAYEFLKDSIHIGEMVTVLDAAGVVLGDVEVTSVRSFKHHDRTLVVKVKAPKAYAKRIAGIRVQEERWTRPLDQPVRRLIDDTIICHCERVTAAEIRTLIRQGYRDLNEIKVVSRAGMGACGAKTCTSLIHRLFREEGVAEAEWVDQVKRPLFMEVPLGVFAGVVEKEKKNRA